MNKIECICPSCGCEHVKYKSYAFTGNGTMRKYCDDCKGDTENMQGLYTDIDDDFPIDEVDLTHWDYTEITYDR